jgi:hypothetical protein
MENITFPTLYMAYSGACNSSILSPLGSFQRVVFINVQNSYTHIKYKENSKIPTKILIAQSSHENAWTKVIMYNRHNDCYIEHMMRDFIMKT